MSDKGKRGGGGNATANAGSVNGAAAKPRSTVSGDGRAFSARLLKLQGDVEALCGDSGLLDYDNLRQSEASLRDELETIRGEMGQMREQVAEMKKERDKANATRSVQLEDFGSKYSAWQEERKRHERDAEEISRLKSELATVRQRAGEADDERKQLRRELNKTKADLADYEKKYARVKETLGRRESKLREVDDELRDCRETLSKLRDELGLCPWEEVKLKESFERLDKDCLALAQQYFCTNIPSPETAIGVLQQPLSLIPVVASNSAAAQLMRCATAEAAIAQGLSRHIFQDFYRLEDVVGPEGNVIVGVLDKLRETNAREAAIIRFQLARASSTETAEDKILEEAVQSVSDVLGSWLAHDAAQKRQFLEGLAGIYRDAMGVWKKVQRCWMWVRPVTELVGAQRRIWFPDDERQLYDGVPLPEGRPDYAGPPPMTGSPFNTVAVLFPQIQVEATRKSGKDEAGEEGEDEPLFAGHALFSTQKAVIAALAERQQNPAAAAASSPTQRRRASRDSSAREQRASRRMSVASASEAATAVLQQRSVLSALSDVSYSGGIANSQ